MKDLSKVFQLTNDFLKAHQDEKGSWQVEEVKHGEPSIYQSPLIISAQCLLTLAYCQKQDSVKNISKAAHFVYAWRLHERDPVDFWAWKTQAMRYVNTDLYRGVVKRNQAHIANDQKAEGFWPLFPNTFNLTNFSCVLALSKSEYGKNIDAARKWFLANKAKDGIGWGCDNNSEVTQDTFTANIACALMSAGESPLSEDMQKVRKYLEGRQTNEGAWCSTRFTTTHPTSYATAVVVEVLMRLAENPFSPAVEKGIKYLVSCQNADGSWPLIKGDRETQYYTNLYAIRTLAFYDYLKKSWEKPENRVLINSDIPKQLVVAHLAEEFENNIAKKLSYNVAKEIFSSRFLGITKKAVARRKDILKILSGHPSLEVAEIIDELKKMPIYENLHKKTHLTQIKSDLEYLRSLNLAYLKGYKYFITFDFDKL